MWVVAARIGSARRGQRDAEVFSEANDSAGDRFGRSEADEIAAFGVCPGGQPGTAQLAHQNLLHRCKFGCQDAGVLLHQSGDAAGVGVQKLDVTELLDFVGADRLRAEKFA